MHEEFAPINQMRAVTISREYGSGGGEIAARLAKRLGWQVLRQKPFFQMKSIVTCSTGSCELPPHEAMW